MTDETKTPEDEETEASDPPAPTEEAPVEPAPVAKPKKKKGKKGDAKANPEANTEGAEKLEVLDASPEGRQLKEAQVAFEIGDYATTRAIASKLASHERPTIADGARDLLRRTDVDPAQMVFLAACLCALIGVAFYYLR